ncbi:hypothetical protein NDU88_002839 [Pleurodeles waltl]|uniref:Uncharacterized protein n=1 Tax=Pleurodeles waltl TaxID=8319 RepID=A0AAV7TM85_PLEWA|nr:hypothetical protein NDU88_002839 [Pleurodeles waltl]
MSYWPIRKGGGERASQIVGRVDERAVSSAVAGVRGAVLAVQAVAVVGRPLCSRLEDAAPPPRLGLRRRGTPWVFRCSAVGLSTRPEHRGAPRGPPQ